MAQWRPLHRRITQSEKVLALGSNDTARWIYCALLPYTDREGRINANPMGLAGTILEGFPYSPDDIQAALEALAGVGLIELYQTARHQLLAQFTNFELSKPHAKEPQSELPGPEDSGTEPLTFAGTPSGTPSEPVREDSGKVPGNGTAKPAEPIPEKPGTVAGPDVHMHVHVQRDVHKPLSADADASDSPPPVKKSKKSTGPTNQEFLDTWNEYRGKLPRADTANGREKFFARMRRELGDEALNYFRDAVQQVAREPYYLERGYGIGHLLSGDNGKVLKWAEKWRDGGGLSDGNRAVASTAMSVADAIGGME